MSETGNSSFSQQQVGAPSRTIADEVMQKRVQPKPGFPLIDHRPEAQQMRNLQRMADRFTQKQFPLIQQKVKGAPAKGQPVQLAGTTLPDPTQDFRIEELNLVLDSESVFDPGLGAEAGEAYRAYLNGTKEDKLPTILGQVKAILAELEKGTRKVPKSWAHVPIAQIAAIIGHSMQGYVVNDDLRKKDGDLSKFPNLLKNYAQIGNTVLGMDLQAPYHGWVYRGQSIPESLVGEYKVGKTVVFKGFTSTTKSALVSDQFKPTKETEVGMMLTILSVTGRDISEIAHDPTEQEVLFSPGTEFRVESCVPGEKVHEITMVESSAGDLLAPPPDRLMEIAKERQAKEEQQKKQQEEAPSGPSNYDMLMALIMAGKEPSSSTTPQELKELYDKHILKL